MEGWKGFLSVQEQMSRLLRGNCLSGVSVLLGDKLQSGAMQVCLAAEKCGNLDFDVRNDMWNSSEGLFCNTSVLRSITFWDILTKVSRLQHEHVQKLCAIPTTSFSTFAATELVAGHSVCSLHTLQHVSITSKAAYTHHNNHHYD